MLNDTEYKAQVKERLKSIMAKGVRLDFFVFTTGINKNTLYTFSKPSADKSISKEKLDRISAVIDQLERIMYND